MRISDIVSAKFFAGNKENYKPGEVVTRFGDVVSRVAVLACVIEKFSDRDGRFNSILLDDGSETIQARAFGSDMEILNRLNLGDPVFIAGRMKNYNDENYIAPDFARNISDPNEETLFRLEVLQNIMKKKGAADDIRKLRDEMSQEELADYASEKYGMTQETVQAIVESKNLDVDNKPMILEIIDKLDEGEGVEIGKLLESVKLDQGMIESVINDLLSDGEVYEPVVGKLRRVRA